MNNPSPILIPILGIIFLFGAPVAAWIVSRVFSHQERMEMIRRGVVPPPMSDRYSWRDARRGMTWQSGPGVGMPPPGAVPPPFYANDPYDYAQNKLRKGITLTLIGLALVVALPLFNSGHAGPWLLGGLIPMFIGIAQVINALMCGAQFPFMAQGQPQPPGNSTNFGPPPSAPSSGAPPYGWRPGSTPEIEKPVYPPDQR